MTILIYDIPHKKQTKMNDCWYACIQMLQSWKGDQKVKPKGAAVAKHRNIWAFGRTLGFGSPQGKQVKTDNGLISIGLEIDCQDIDTVHDALKKYGPFIVGGKYGPCGAGHFVVICGVNTDTGMIYRDNPAWGYEKAWKKLSYLEKAWMIKGSLNIDSDSCVSFKAL